MKYIISDSGVVNAFVGGEAYTFDKNHHNYNALIRHLKSGNVEHFEAAYDVASSVEHFCDGYVHVKNGTLNWNGIPMPELFTDRILDMKKEGFDFDSMLNFMCNLNDNPSDKSILELFDFMQNKNLPITQDGYFLAYKAVRPDFKDIYSGSIDNSVGEVVEVDRSKVDSNRNRHCSAGLHVGAMEVSTWIVTTTMIVTAETRSLYAKSILLMSSVSPAMLDSKSYEPAVMKWSQSLRMFLINLLKFWVLLLIMLVW